MHTSIIYKLKIVTAAILNQCGLLKAAGAHQSFKAHRAALAREHYSIVFVFHSIGKGKDLASGQRGKSAPGEEPTALPQIVV